MFPPTPFGYYVFPSEGFRSTRPERVSRTNNDHNNDQDRRAQRDKCTVVDKIAEMWEHIATIQKNISRNFQRSFSRTNKTRTDGISCLKQAFDKTRRVSSLFGTSVDASDSFNAYRNAVVDAVSAEGKIWNGNSTVDQVLADQVSILLWPLMTSTGQKSSGLSLVPDGQDTSTGHEGLPLVPGLYNRAETWPQTRPE